MAGRAVLTPAMVELLNEAEAKGLVLKSEDIIKTSIVTMGIPPDFPKEILERLKNPDTRPQVRLLWRVRALSKWLAEETESFLHGESGLEGDAYGDLIDLFVNGDRVLRFVYSFEGCIWGAKGCDASVPHSYAPVLCEGCVRGKKGV